MKKKLLLFVVGVMLLSCNFEIGSNLSSQIDEELLEGSRYTVRDFLTFNDEYFTSKKITQEHIWYNPSVEGPAYIEFVTDANEYVFVSLVENDVTIGAFGRGTSLYNYMKEEFGDGEFTPFKLTNSLYVFKGSDKNLIFDSNTNEFTQSKDSRSVDGVFDEYLDYVESNDGILSVDKDFFKENTSTDSRWFSNPFADKPALIATLPSYTTQLPSYDQYGRANDSSKNFKTQDVFLLLSLWLQDIGT